MGPFLSDLLPFELVSPVIDPEVRKLAGFLLDMAEDHFEPKCLGDVLTHVSQRCRPGEHDTEFIRAVAEEIWTQSSAYKKADRKRAWLYEEGEPERQALEAEHRARAEARERLLRIPDWGQF